MDAFDKTIAADPNKAAAYYLKGELLFGMATTDSEGKIIPPPGIVEALQKYLELQPNGTVRRAGEELSGCAEHHSRKQLWHKQSDE